MTRYETDRPLTDRARAGLPARLRQRSAEDHATARTLRKAARLVRKRNPTGAFGVWLAVDEAIRANAQDRETPKRARRAFDAEAEGDDGIATAERVAELMERAAAKIEAEGSR